MGKPVEIAFVSGKGGRGKTVLAASLANITLGSVIVDCDVDMPKMHLLLGSNLGTEHRFPGDKIAVIDPGRCARCGECFRACRFGAVRESDIPGGWAYTVDALSCEGCAVCAVVCPENAVEMAESPPGSWYTSRWEFGPLLRAHHPSAWRNSDTLIRTLRREARGIAARQAQEYIIIDGPAGVGAFLIAAVAGTSLAIVVTEPTVSGIHDLRRVLRLLEQMAVRTAGVINKHDLNAEVTGAIEEYLSVNGIPLLGKIPFSADLNRAVARVEAILENREDPAIQTIKETCNRALAMAVRGAEA